MALANTPANIQVYTAFPPQHYGRTRRCVQLLLTRRCTVFSRQLRTTDESWNVYNNTNLPLFFPSADVLLLCLPPSLHLNLGVTNVLCDYMFRRNPDFRYAKKILTKCSELTSLLSDADVTSIQCRRCHHLKLLHPQYAYHHSRCLGSLLSHGIYNKKILKFSISNNTLDLERFSLNTSFTFKTNLIFGVFLTDWSRVWRE